MGWGGGGCDLIHTAATDLLLLPLSPPWCSAGPRSRRCRGLIRLLTEGLAHVGSVAGFLAAAELQLEAGNAAGALASAKAGIKFVFERSR